MRARDFFSILLTGIWCAPLSATASEAPPPSIPSISIAEPPAGYTQMCRRDASLCDAENFAAVHDENWDTKSLIGTLRHVNRAVNSAIQFREDRKEYWTAVPLTKGAKGDCEDYAITKRMQLLAMGFPANKLYYAVAYVPRVGLHTVLIANVDGEDLVLDNRTPWIERWSATPYVWLLRQSPSEPSIWYSTFPESDDPNVIALAT